MKKLCIAPEQPVGNARDLAAAHFYPQSRTNVPQLSPLAEKAQGTDAAAVSDLSRIAADLISYY